MTLEATVAESSKSDQFEYDPPSLAKSKNKLDSFDEAKEKFDLKFHSGSPAGEYFEAEIRASRESKKNALLYKSIPNLKTELLNCKEHEKHD